MEKIRGEKEIMETNTTIQKNTTQPRITLNKLSTAKYSWTIVFDGDNLDIVIDEIERVNNILLKKFINKEKTTKGKR